MPLPVCLTSKRVFELNYFSILMRFRVKFLAGTIKIYFFGLNENRDKGKFDSILSKFKICNFCNFLAEVLNIPETTKNSKQLS